MNGSKGVEHRGALVITGIILLAAGLLIGVFSPSRWLPHPLILLALALIFLDVFLSSLLAVKEGRKLNSPMQFLLLVAFVFSLFLVTLISGLRPELTVIVPLVIREAMLISRVV